MSLAAITQLVIQYRYLILLPLSFIEGPIVAFIAGTLASLGYFNIYVLAVFFLVRDIIVDLASYMLGRFLGKKEFTHRFLRRMHIYDDDIKKVRYMWNTHPGKTMFFSKLSYGVAAGFIVIAGMVEAPLWLFMTWGVIVTFLHYGTLLFLGYFFAGSFGSVSKIFENLQYVIGGLILLGTIYYFVKRSITSHLKIAEEEAGKEEAAEEEGMIQEKGSENPAEGR